MRLIFSSYPVMMPVMLAMILFTSIINALPSVFIQKIIALININSSYAAISADIFKYLLILLTLYILSLIGAFIYSQLTAFITQGVLKNLRCEMFNKMQDLPLRYFDAQERGDIMSKFTNDVDALRQLISQGAPQLLTAFITLSAILFIMLYYCLWLTLITLTGVYLMIKITKRVGGRSSKNFVLQQRHTGKLEGFTEEILNGQKVVKVFGRETASILEFNKLNQELFIEAEKANKRANTLGPILNNIGNILYVIMALAGGLLILFNAPNVSLSGLPMSISIIIPFLNMTKQFAGQVNQLSVQLNSIISGLAGTGRIFNLIDQEPELDAGVIELENIKIKGEIKFNHVSFSYIKDREILHDINITAKPGQKIALVGSTGAGKTTVINLLTRFYDVTQGEILYDGINIKQIKKSSLRKNLGMVLQDVNLFTGSVLDNIRYGNLTLTDKECVQAAKFAGADEFINKLNNKYNTLLFNNAANLSQGQRQLIAIARAAAANPPVLILDEATSSIDTRTELLVQRGMDALIKQNGRTVFIIAHRLSTVRSADIILLIEQGRIIEQGTHEQLLNLRGRYYDLYTGAFELK